MDMDTSAERRHTSLYVSFATRLTRCSFMLHSVGFFFSFFFSLFLFREAGWQRATPGDDR